MQLFDLQQDFFRPLWIRVAVVAVCLGWGVFEFVTGATLWGIIFTGMGLFALWQLFFDGWPGSENKSTE
ncbi:hypothetical protein AB833_32490 [Chromatiales bacterium (ex Bugula neritina AB1)]|nr:hypothetical protein AB833_32490 [Chromatiales bacterium (ex Bugula neritina AB1)]